MRSHGPRADVKQKQPGDWSSGIIPPPLLVSMASNIFTTSDISGRFSGFPSQHFRMTFARELGQHLGIVGRRFCQPNSHGIKDVKQIDLHLIMVLQNCNPYQHLYSKYLNKRTTFSSHICLLQLQTGNHFVQTCL